MHLILAGTIFLERHCLSYFTLTGWRENKKWESANGFHIRSGNVGDKSSMAAELNAFMSESTSALCSPGAPSRNCFIASISHLAVSPSTPIARPGWALSKTDNQSHQHQLIISHQHNHALPDDAVLAQQKK